MLPLKLPEQEKQEEDLRWLQIRLESWQRIVQKSAVNTRDLIDKTLVEIDKGNNITRTTADAFNQIIADMESFAELAENTMEKANSQAESLEQIGQGIEQLSGVVQGNAASSEENTAISINLAEGAVKMHDRVNIFKLF